MNKLITNTHLINIHHSNIVKYTFAANPPSNAFFSPKQLRRQFVTEAFAIPNTSTNSIAMFRGPCASDNDVKTFLNLLTVPCSITNSIINYSLLIPETLERAAAQGKS